MKLHINESTFIETSEPIDISLSLSNSSENPTAWYVNPPTFEPVRTEHYTGSVKEGGNVNFRDIYFNPHGHGTHTECLGHITEEVYSVNQRINEFFYKAQLITVQPSDRMNADGMLDQVITADLLKDVKNDCDALIIRTLPNQREKRTMQYSNSNPAYLDIQCAETILRAGIKHLLVDLPSVDRENDNGELAFHHAFWEVPSNPNHERTITELIYVDPIVIDGIYLLNLQVAPFENDAAPSRPVLYKLKED